MSKTRSPENKARISFSVKKTSSPPYLKQQSRNHQGAPEPHLKLNLIYLLVQSHLCDFCVTAHPVAWLLIEKQTHPLLLL